MGAQRAAASDLVPRARVGITQHPDARDSVLSAGQSVRSCYAGVSSDRTNLSPFTKDYRGLALPCELRVFVARKGAIHLNNFFFVFNISRERRSFLAL